MVIHLLTYTLHITYNVDTRDPIGSKNVRFSSFYSVKMSYETGLDFNEIENKIQCKTQI